MGMPYPMDPQQPSDDTYALKRDYNASSRLLGQHHLWKSELGYLIHPSIPIPSQPRIADVATGNGCWLLDVAQDLPNPYNLHGFDISLDQAPTTTLDPTSFSTIRFHTWDIMNDPPKVFIGAFDIVHIRLITVVFSENEKAVPIIESLRKLLKPGGYLQWEEVDNTSCTVLPSPDGSRAPAMEQALSQLASSGKGGWKEEAARLLNKNGFTNAQQFHIEPTEYHARYWTDIYLACWAEFAGKVLGNPEKAKALGEEAMKEARRGAVIVCPVWVWVAQKSTHVSRTTNGVSHGMSNGVSHGMSNVLSTTPHVASNGMSNGLAMTPNGTRKGMVYDHPTRPDRNVYIAGPHEVLPIGPDKNMHVDGPLDARNGTSEHDTDSMKHATKKPSFLQRSKFYRSMKNLKAA